MKAGCCLQAWLKHVSIGQESEEDNEDGASS